MRFGVVTLFPKLIAALDDDGVVGNAIRARQASVACFNPRDYAKGTRPQVDDSPFGGGPGMVLRPEPLAAAIRDASQALPQARVVYLSPGGRRFDNAVATELAAQRQLILVCGRYQGIDERVVESCIDMELSVGDFIVSGGELPAMLVIDAVVRQLDGVLGCEESLAAESFSAGGLAPPCYTRPREFEGRQVPEVLLSGDHKAIEAWRREQADRRTHKWLAGRQEK